MGRIIVFTGKGGVGKTSIAAITACKIAEEGKKVLIMSTDEAHSLSDSFNLKLTNEPTEISKSLFGMEIDVVKENEVIWGNLQGYLKDLVTAKSEETIESEELLVFPGFQELISLIKIKQFADENSFDVLIVDCAPTGETMSLLKFPDLFKTFMKKVFPMKRKAAKIAGPIVEKTIKIPMPDDETMNEIELLYDKIDGLHKLMLDKTRTSIRIVTTPEKIVVTEAKRSFSFLHLFNYNVDAIIVNKIFPESSIDGYFSIWKEKQNQGIKDIEDSFRGIPVFKMELMETELRGYNTLKKMGMVLFNNKHIEEVLFKEKIFEIIKEENKNVLAVYLPTVNKDELNLYQKGDELIISIKNERRNLVLPSRLQGQEITKAKYDNGRLNIYFV